MPISLSPQPTPIVITSTAQFQAHVAEVHQSLFPGDALKDTHAAALASLLNAIGYNNATTAKTALERISATAADIASRVVV